MIDIIIINKPNISLYSISIILPLLLIVVYAMIDGLYDEYICDILYKYYYIYYK
jgi:hypothetical protein